MQTFWDTDNEYPNTTNLYPIKPIIKDLLTSYRKNCQEQVVLCRLRLGTCLFNKKHKYKGEPHPLCRTCHVEETIIHVMLDCPSHSNERRDITQILNNLGLPRTLDSILSDEFPLQHVFTYLRRINFFNRI